MLLFTSARESFTVIIYNAYLCRRAPDWPRFRSFSVHSSSTSPLLIGPCGVFDDVIGSRAALSLSVFRLSLSLPRAPVSLFSLYMSCTFGICNASGGQMDKDFS